MRETVVWTISLALGMAKKAEAPAGHENRSRSEPVREALRRHAAQREWNQTQAWASARAQALGVTDENRVEEIVDELRRRT